MTKRCPRVLAPRRWCKWIGKLAIGTALATGARWRAFLVLCLESIPLEALNGWVRSPRLVQLACVPKALNWFGDFHVFNPTTDRSYSGAKAFAALTKCSRKRPPWQWLEEWSSISGACAPDVRVPKNLDWFSTQKHNPKK